MSGPVPAPLAASPTLGLTGPQIRLLLLVALPLSLGPAVVVGAHARSSDHVEHWLAWALLAGATSLVGVVAYWEHTVIREKRAGGNPDDPSDGSDP